ncbi:MAG: futalosine hydrolase [Gemmatimonadota bacterium]|jgi:futalosine hydrolase|nr:futalosine hydrolase [Gemmatimonadota bacterium]
MNPIFLICAVEFEARPLLARIERPEVITIGRRSAWRGRISGREVVVLPGGMGKTNAAQALTAALEHSDAAGVLGFGVAGAYPASGLLPGAVALATEENYGDEGVETPAGWISCEGIGIPLLDQEDSRLFNRFPVDAVALRAAARMLPHAVTGPFVTVSTCSGTTDRGAVLTRRYSAICETMEGAAFAHVARLYDVPYLEVRGISNLVEDRDLSQWKLADAARAACDAAETILAGWDAGDGSPVLPLSLPGRNQADAVRPDTAGSTSNQRSHIADQCPDRH